MIGMIEFEEQKKRLEDNYGKKFTTGQLTIIIRFVNKILPLDAWEFERVVTHFIASKKSLPVPNDFLEAARSEVRRRQNHKPSTEERDPPDHPLCRDTGIVWKLCDGIPIIHHCYCEKGSVDDGFFRITIDDINSLAPFPDEDFKPKKISGGSMMKAMEERVNWLKSEKHMAREYKIQMESKS
jgi:hypothetical protein